jgi:hypothetical protein
MGQETAGEAVDVEWVRADGERPDPLVERAPYLELALEHPDLDATHADGRYFPDAVPYRLDGERRVFYWRSVLPGGVRDGGAPGGFWATTHELRPLGAGTGGLAGPELSSADGDVHEVVVDGTVAGDSTTARVEGYSPPRIAVRSLDADSAVVAACDETVTVQAGGTATVEFPEQPVVPEGESGRVSVTPVLRARFPGERVVYHPPVGGERALFPSFGLDLARVPNPVAVPTAHGELDHGALADVLSVDLGSRPFAERTLWQAFAYAAFDPHREEPPRIRQTDGGLLVVANPAT